MSWETLITLGCVMAAALVLVWSFGKRAVRAEYRLELFNECAHQSRRAAIAEAALARVEAELARREKAEMLAEQAAYADALRKGKATLNELRDSLDSKVRK